MVVLAHATDNPHADLFVRLSEVDPDGGSRNVSEGFLRLDPDASTGSIRLGLDAVAHRFTAGNRVRVVVAGGSHPRWERNLGTDDDPASSARMAPCAPNHRPRRVAAGAAGHRRSSVDSVALAGGGSRTER